MAKTIDALETLKTERQILVDVTYRLPVEEEMDDVHAGLLNMIYGFDAEIETLENRNKK